jgi:hypothetical protein
MYTAQVQHRFADGHARPHQSRGISGADLWRSVWRSRRAAVEGHHTPRSSVSCETCLVCACICVCVCDCGFQCAHTWELASWCVHACAIAEYGMQSHGCAHVRCLMQRYRTSDAAHYVRASSLECVCQCWHAIIYIYIYIYIYARAHCVPRKPESAYPVIFGNICAIARQDLNPDL